MFGRGGGGGMLGRGEGSGAGGWPNLVSPKKEETKLNAEDLLEKLEGEKYALLDKIRELEKEEDLWYCSDEGFRRYFIYYNTKEQILTSILKNKTALSRDIQDMEKEKTESQMKRSEFSDNRNKVSVERRYLLIF